MPIPIREEFFPERNRLGRWFQNVDDDVKGFPVLPKTG